MSTLSQFYDKGTVKSIQRGYISSPTQSSFTVTVSAVDVGKSLLLATGLVCTSSGTGYALTSERSATLTNSTTITFGQFIGSGASSISNIDWQLIEFY